MSATIVVGGFYGDEGKGKIAAYLGLKDDYSMAVRVGSVNAGHTVVHGGRRWKLRLIPSAFINPKTRLGLGPGSLIRLDVLWRELGETGVGDRLRIDYRAGVIEQKHRERELNDEFLVKVVGTTGQGVGAAAAERALRKLRLAKDYPELQGFVGDLVGELLDIVENDGRVLLEGTQGFYLSLFHGEYPYVTSRDTTAAAVLSEAGLGPRHVEDIVVVFKSYVTRVGGGPLPGELSDEEAARRGWLEIATVTGRKRRAAPFNYELALRAVKVNTATQVAITKLDILFPETRGKRRWDDLSRKAREWVEEVEEKLGVPVTLIGTGEDALDIVDRRREVIGP